CQQHNSYLYTF
nr:immunoglobulin light chain junction region [Macaca mulatta]